MSDREQKIKECIDFLNRNSMLVLATQGSEGPYTSLMGYCCAGDGREIYMLSSRDSQKWENLKYSRKVSLLIDDRDGKLENNRESIKALTVEGEFVQVSDKDEEREIMDLISESTDSIASVFYGPECSVIRIKVNSFLLLDGPEKAFFSGKL